MKNKLDKINKLMGKEFFYGDAGLVINLPSRLILEDIEIDEVVKNIENIILKLELGEPISKLEILMLQLFKESY